MKIARAIQPDVSRRLQADASVILLGPRQVGKTTLARQIAADQPEGAIYLDLERPADRLRLDDADTFLRAQSDTLVVIDEIHRAPGLFETLRGIIDDRRALATRTGNFLLLGSAGLDLMRQSTESLAGRIAYVELAPINVSEFAAAERVAGAGSVDRLWIRGGFPRSLLAATDGDSLAWRRDFVRSYLERDVPMFAPRMPAETVARLWGMLAHGQGTLLNQARLASSLGFSQPAIGRYIDLLVDLLLVRRLRAWSSNIGKRLVRAPKVYVRDSGLLHALLDLESWSDVLGHPVVGSSWEGFVIENLIAAAGDRRVPFFYRTADGAEIDLVFERGGQVEMAIEIKRTTAPALSKGFELACAALEPRHRFVVHGGTDEWTMRNGVVAISLTGLMRQLDSGFSRGHVPR